MVKRLRLKDGSERKAPRRPETPADDEKPSTDGFSLRFSAGRGVLALENEEISSTVQLDSLELVIPKIAFPFDISKGVRGLRNKRLKLSRLKLTVGLDALLQSAMERIASGSWTTNPVVSLQEDCLCVLVDYGPPGSEVPFGFRLLPVMGDRSLTLVLDEIRSYGPLPAPLLRTAAVVVSELTGGGLEGISVVPQDPVKSSLLKVLPGRGWRLPAYEDVCLTGFALLPDRCEMEFKSRQVFNEEDALSKNRLSMERLRRLEELRFSEEPDARLAQGEIEEARTGYVRLLDRTPDNPAIATRLAMIDVLNPSLRDTVRRYLSDSIKDWEEREDSLAVMAHGAAIAGDVENEVEALEKMFAHSHPLERLATAVRLGELLQETDPEKAVQYLEKGLVARRENPRAMHALIATYAAMGDKEKVISLIPGWIAIHRDPDAQAGAHLQAGKILLEVEEHAASARHFERASLANPENDEAAWGLATALSGTGEVQRAIAGFEQLAANCQEQGDVKGAAAALSAIGAIWTRQGEPDLAVPRLRDSLQRHWNSETQVILAGALVALGRIDEGVLNYEEALKRDRRRDKMWGNWALTLARLHYSHLEDYPGAERWIKEAGVCDGMADAAAKLRIQVLEKQKKWGELAGELERDLVKGGAGEDMPLQTVLRLTRARVAAGEYQPAVSTLESALAQNPGHAELLDVYIQATRASGAVHKLEDTLNARYPMIVDPAQKAQVAAEAGWLRLREFEDPKGAVEWFRRALADDGELFEAREGLLEGLERLGDVAHMDAELEVMISRYLDMGRRAEAADAMCRLGRIFIARGEKKKGADLLRQALPDLPVDTRQSAVLDIAGIFYEEKEYALARDMYARARRGSNLKDNYLAALGQAESAIRIGDYQSAYDAAVAAGSGPTELRGRAVKTMAAAAVPLGKVRDALGMLGRVAQNVNEAEANELFDLAANMAWKELGDFNMAREFYEEILEMDPYNERARNRMISLLESSGHRGIWPQD